MKLILGLLALFAVIVALGIAPNCWTLVESVDINSGRIRQRHYLCGVCVHEAVSETSLSIEILPNEFDAPADWHSVYEFCPPWSHHSPMCAFAHASNQVEQVEATWRFLRFNPAAKHQVAKDVLYLWRRDGQSGSASEYLGKLWEALGSRGENGKAIDIVDLPSPESKEK